MQKKPPPTSSAYLVMTNIPPKKWLGVVTEQRQTIGRGTEAHLRLPAEFVFVSRAHAEIWSDSDGHWIKDLDSSSGTRVNAVPLAPNESFRLILGDHLWVGAAEFDLVADANLSHRRPLLRGEDETIGFHLASGTVEFSEAAPDLFASLTPAEIDVVLWMSRGFTDLEEVSNQVFPQRAHDTHTHDEHFS
jgi:predicted component of type VI protein secretion system